MLFPPETHAANHPTTWVVKKATPRLWNVTAKDGGVIASARTKREAESLTREGFFVNLYETEGRWYAGEQIPGYVPFAESRMARRLDSANTEVSP